MKQGTQEQSNSAEAGSDLARKYLTFSLGGCEYALVIHHVREIIAMHPITPLPRLPEYVRGVFNLRGKIIPAVDLRLRLGLEALALGPAACIIVAELEDTEGNSPELVGCIVDSVSDVRDIQPSDVQAVPCTEQWVSEEHVEGLVQCEDGVVAVLSMSHVLGDALAPSGVGEPEAIEVGHGSDA